MRILVADDDATVRSELAELLRGDGHETETAGDGAEAIRMIEASEFDAVLLDLVMPEFTGLDVLRRARSVCPETAVIMVTGQGTIDAAVEAMKSGAVDFIQKPPELEAIQRSLRALAEERTARALLANPSTDGDAVRAVLADGARREALLAVLGSGLPAPPGTVRVLRIAEAPDPPDTFSPAQLYQVNVAVEAHVGRVPHPVVYAAGLSLLAQTHGPDDICAWVRQLRERCASREGTLVLGASDAAYTTEVESRSPEGVDAGIQRMLESLANPTRRAIVAFVFASGPVAYSGILKRNFVDSSSKLSFHLQKLQSDGLLTKVKEGRYGLTEDGRRAWRVVRALQVERSRPSLVVAPP